MKDKIQKESNDESMPQTPAGEREQRIFDFWKDRQIFKKTLAKASPKGNYVFYDGPPYATGLPHFGHVLPTTVKDLIPRYKTMQGYFVPRRWGWDCHGLPVETLIEKEMGIKSKREIEEIGVDAFNTAARNSVLRYANEWKEIIPRLGRWVDMDDDYRTMDSSYMESVMWSFGELNKKGLVYEGYKVMPYCPRCGTTLSNFEVAQGYKDITDLSAYIKFELEDEKGTFFIAWTTTPWTVPGNVALAVNPDILYSKVETSMGMFWLATATIQKLKEKKFLEESAKVLEEVKGAALVGKSYRPVFQYFVNGGTMGGDNEARRAHAWKVYGADFVTAEDGTGIVHIAPAYGEDDMNLSRRENLPVIHHVGADGLFVAAATDFSGQQAKPKDDHQKGDVEIIKHLAHTGTLFAKEKYIHSYPHCWRCETPLLNFATSSWFVKVTAIKEKLVAANNKIMWTPKEIGEGRFGKWLEGARDWAVSRSRYWGTPLPVWRAEHSGKTEFINSVAELRSKIQNNGNTIILMRHGESESNIKDVINSHDLDAYGLTEKGKEEVRRTSLKFKDEYEKTGKTTIIYSSDIRRARETADIMAEAIGSDKTKIIHDARLREIDGGDFDGGKWSDRATYFNNMTEKIFKRVPNGESVADVKRRVGEFLYDIESQYKDAQILVVMHGLPLRMMLHTAMGKTSRDLIRSGWTDISEPTASLHVCDFVPLPHNEDFELDLHRPYIDAITWKNADGETMRRVPEIFDVWYDSGSMSFAQNHYPFEHTDDLLTKGSDLFPADFIAEGLDQTRGWFYLLLVMSVGLFDIAAYKSVIVNGLILAEDGRKMSKSLNNYSPLMQTVEKYGADALRYFLISSPAVRGEEVAFSEKGLDEVNKKLFNRLENVYTFYKTYAGKVKTDLPVQSTNILDRWMLARLNQLITEVTASLEAFQLDKASRPIAEFIDDLSTWYLRRSRDRFKGDDEVDKKCALTTTRFVLDRLTKVMAPFTPFIAEDMYQKVKDAGAAESVHLEQWPVALPVDVKLLEEMAIARKLVEEGLSLRAKAGIKVRQPLASFTYNASISTVPSELFTIIADELNVKEVRAGELVCLDIEITPSLKVEGHIRELVRAVQDMRKQAGLSTSDLITLTIDADDASKQIIEDHRSILMKSVLAQSLEYSRVEEGDDIFSITIDDHVLKIRLNIS